MYPCVVSNSTNSYSNQCSKFTVFIDKSCLENFQQVLRLPSDNMFNFASIRSNIFLLTLPNKINFSAILWISPTVFRIFKIHKCNCLSDSKIQFFKKRQNFISSLPMQNTNLQYIHARSLFLMLPRMVVTPHGMPRSYIPQVPK